MRAVRHLHHVSGARVFDHEAEGLVENVQHLAEGFAVIAGHLGGVFVRNLEPLVVGVGDLKRHTCVAVVVVFGGSCLCR